MSETRALRCPSCGSPIEPTTAEAEVSTCKACGSVLDLSSDELSILTTLKAKDFPLRSFIKLGLEGTFSGKRYQVIGRICFRSSIREWDNEDKDYYNSSWTYDEWILVGENKEYLYICEDEEGYSLETPFTPTAPNIPDPGDTHMTLSAGDRRHRIIEFADATIDHFEGEFTYVPYVGERVRAAEYQAGGTTFSVNSRLKKDSSEIAEVEFFSAVPINKLALATAFGLDEIVEKERALLEKEKEFRKWSWGFFGAAALLTVLFIGSCSGGGTKIFEQALNFNQVSEDGTLVGPFDLTRKDSVHRIELRSSFGDNSWAWGGMELLDESYEVVNAAQKEFWRESGRDSDGRWSESDLVNKTLFRLDHPGKYYARLFVERGTANTGSIIFRVYEGVILSRFYLLSLLFCLGMGYSLRRFKTVNPIYAIIGVLILGYIILEMLPNED